MVCWKGITLHKLEGQRLNGIKDFIYLHEVVEVAGDLFVVEQNRVWKSIDEGMSWKKVLFEAPFEERTGYGKNLVNLVKI